MNVDLDIQLYGSAGIIKLAPFYSLPSKERFAPVGVGDIPHPKGVNKPSHMQCIHSAAKVILTLVQIRYYLLWVFKRLQLGYWLSKQIEAL
jgi:hypothetical protein